MATKKDAALKKRARTPDQKEDRRQAILAAAIAHAREVGFDGVTMSGLAKQAGLAKGTLYLYFKTREEVFLALYLEALQRWCRRIAEAVQPGQSDEKVVDALSHAVREEPLFLQLAARLSSIIEQNVPVQALIEAKRQSRPLYFDLARHFEKALKLRPNDGIRFGSALVALLLGAAQLDTGSLAAIDGLPEDIREVVLMSQFETIFADGVRILLAGLERSPSSVV